MMKRLPIISPFGDAPVFYKKKTSSTMNDAAGAAEVGAAKGSVFVAGFQEAGRGRLPGRAWDSAAGKNLLFTIYLGNDYFPGRPTLIPLAAAAGVASAIRDCYGIDARIRWPNDVVVDGKKVTGILCVTRGESLYIGIGINCNQVKFAVEPANEVKSIALEAGRLVNRDDLLSSVLSSLFRLFFPDDPIPAIMENLWIPGGECLYIPGPAQGSGDRPIAGRILGVGSYGEMLFLKNGDKTPARILHGSVRKMN